MVKFGILHDNLEKNNFTSTSTLVLVYIGIKKVSRVYLSDNRTLLYKGHFFSCSEICPHDKVTDLPKYKDTEKAEEIEVETRSYCDCEGCEGKKAICYCIDCGKCLCKFHNEVGQIVVISELKH